MNRCVTADASIVITPTLVCLMLLMLLVVFLLPISLSPETG
jgi:hypothetical protein